MFQRTLSPSVLINVSEFRIENIRWSGTDYEREVVNRLFESQSTYRHWESFHAGLMKTVGSGTTRKQQLLQMRNTRFALIHRQALFEYLREAKIVGANREAIVGAFCNTDGCRARSIPALQFQYFLRRSSRVFRDARPAVQQGDYALSQEIHGVFCLLLQLDPRRDSWPRIRPAGDGSKPEERTADDAKESAVATCARFRFLGFTQHEALNV